MELNGKLNSQRFQVQRSPLGLLLIVGSRYALFKTITAFTIAHSITLAIATLGYASAPVPPLNAAIALFVLPLAWILGALLGVIIEGLPTLPVAGISFFILGVLIAADLKLSQKWFTAIVIVVASVHGVLNGVALKEGAGILGLIGIMATLFVIVAIVSAFIVSLKRPWTKIVVRVAGSWVAAIGMLLFGWLMRGQG